MSRILIVEDEESIAELEKDYLELSGFEVEIENNGRVGLERALQEEFDLFILDLMLPGVDGFEICKKIRESKNTPIIMVSAKKDDIDKIRGLRLGADDYITKPFSPSETVARVKDVYKRQGPDAPVESQALRRMGRTSQWAAEMGEALPDPPRMIQAAQTGGTPQGGPGRPPQGGGPGGPGRPPQGGGPGGPGRPPQGGPGGCLLYTSGSPLWGLTHFRYRTRRRLKRFSTG